MRNVGLCPITTGFGFSGALGFHVESLKLNSSSRQFDPPEPT